jgi:hypothetical protein
LLFRGRVWEMMPRFKQRRQLYVLINQLHGSLIQKKLNSAMTGYRCHWQAHWPMYLVLTPKSSHIHLFLDQTIFHLDNESSDCL